MPILVTSAQSSPTQQQPDNPVSYEGNGICAYSQIGTSHLASDKPNEDNFFAAIVDEAMLRDAESAKELLRQLRDKGAEHALEVRRNEATKDAATTLVAATFFGDWSKQGNPDERGLALLCIADSAAAWRDKPTGKVIQLTVAQETVVSVKDKLTGEDKLITPITNYLGLNRDRHPVADQDRTDQVIILTEAQLRTLLQENGINGMDGELLMYCDGPIQTAHYSHALDNATKENRAAQQLQYDQETTRNQAEKIEELGKQSTKVTNKAQALVNAAVLDGSTDDLTVITVDALPAINSQKLPVVCICDGAGGHAGGWQASNGAIAGAGEWLETMERRHLEESKRRSPEHTYNQFDPYDVIASSVGSWSFRTEGGKESAFIELGPQPNLALLRALESANITVMDAHSARHHGYIIHVFEPHTQSLRNLVDPGTILRETMGEWEPVGQRNGLSYHPNSSASYTAVTNALKYLGFQPDAQTVTEGNIHIPPREDTSRAVRPKSDSPYR